MIINICIYIYAYIGIYAIRRRYRTLWANIRTELNYRTGGLLWSGCTVTLPKGSQWVALWAAGASLLSPSRLESLSHSRGLSVCSTCLLERLCLLDESGWGWILTSIRLMNRTGWCFKVFSPNTRTTFFLGAIWYFWNVVWKVNFGACVLRRNDEPPTKRRDAWLAWTRAHDENMIRKCCRQGS